MFPVGEFDRVTSGWIERGFLKRRNGQREHEIKTSDTIQRNELRLL